MKKEEKNLEEELEEDSKEDKEEKPEEIDKIGKIRKIKLNKIKPSDEKGFENFVDLDEDSKVVLEKPETSQKSLEIAVGSEPINKDQKNLPSKKEESFKYSIEGDFQNSKKYNSFGKAYSAEKIDALVTRDFPISSNDGIVSERISSSLREKASYHHKGLDSIENNEVLSTTTFGEFEKKKNDAMSRKIKYSPSEH